MRSHLTGLSWYSVPLILKGQLVAWHEHYIGIVTSIAWSPDGSKIALGSSVIRDVDGNTIRVWNFATQKQVVEEIEYTSPVFSVAWSPDGSKIASGSADNTIQVWDVATGNRVVEYKGHSGVVFSVAWSPDGKYIASGSSDKTVHVWVALQ